MDIRGILRFFQESGYEAGTEDGFSALRGAILFIISS